MKDLQEIQSISKLKVSATGIDGGGWEHVSVSYRRKTPTWTEMCRVKELFFNDDETVVQYHPCKSEYVNVHQHCLHLWRKCGENAELPLKIFV